MPKAKSTDNSAPRKGLSKEERRRIRSVLAKHNRDFNSDDIDDVLASAEIEILEHGADVSSFALVLGYAKKKAQEHRRASTRSQNDADLSGLLSADVAERGLDEAGGGSIPQRGKDRQRRGELRNLGAIFCQWLDEHGRAVPGLLSGPKGPQRLTAYLHTTALPRLRADLLESLGCTEPVPPEEKAAQAKRLANLNRRLTEWEKTLDGAPPEVVAAIRAEDAARRGRTSKAFKIVALDRPPLQTVGPEALAVLKRSGFPLVSVPVTFANAFEARARQQHTMFSGDTPRQRGRPRRGPPSIGLRARHDVATGLLRYALGLCGISGKTLNELTNHERQVEHRQVRDLAALPEVRDWAAKVRSARAPKSTA